MRFQQSVVTQGELWKHRGSVYDNEVVRRLVRVQQSTTGCLYPGSDFDLLRMTGQITHLQLCVFFPDVDWKRSTLDWGSLSATRRWSTSHGTAPWTTLGLRKAGSFYDSYASSSVVPGSSLWSSLSWERGRAGVTGK
ncbi:hypothetical protein AVEN_251146-1 [Araneus ventricosus]|uniref:Uncharacterized protein n=1 Tax=Araneus ventricosus TaxID=182803 RepID=A0A4Y2WRL0_ARAVE|nr:hypothetical protein AVEN_251146-1 [Araneus ventricosus]